MGSSPLTRGKHVGDLGVLVGRGLIPAHAGKTAPPRAVIAYSCGSSPLTRGKQVVLHVERNERGLIPAHAGKTVVTGLYEGAAQAHPRSRGENSPRQGDGTHDRGSSPLTRGKPPRRRGRSPRARLIPAHAGKTGRWVRRGDRTAAHPRSRGENAAEETAVDIHLGSSPLTRGKLGELVHFLRGHRLIPAHAGKTRQWLRSRGRSEAHPRSRGENDVYGDVMAGREGSSPLTRGKRADHRTPTRPGGLIPAHAGKTHLCH